MKRSTKYREQLAANVAASDTLIKAAEAEQNREFTPEEQTKLTALKAERTRLNARIEEADELDAADAKAPVVKPTAKVTDRAEGDPARGFASHREFLAAVVANADVTNRADVTDDRLKPLALVDDDKGSRGALAFALPLAYSPIKATVGADEQGTYSDPYGGFSVVTTRGAPRPMIGFEGDPTDGRCENIPMASPSIEMEASTDKDHRTSVAGGLTVARKAEAAAAAASRESREMVTLKATSTFGLSYVTEDLLADSPVSWIARISNGFNGQFAAFRFNEKLRGLGGNERLGVLTALSASTAGPTISIAKETGQLAASFLYNNVVNMRARCWGYGNAIWIANHDCYPKLVGLAIPVGVGGQLVYQQSLVEDRPDMLLGRPIFYSEYAATAGTQGDLILGNWSQYMEGLYQPLQSAESIHVRFINHERTLKFWVRDCGAPSWRVPLTPNKSSSTLSPFVVLDTRS